MANNSYKLENMLIRSYAHIRSLELKAYFKAIKDLHFDGLPKFYENQSMTRMQGNRYLMHAYNRYGEENESYCLNVDTLKAERLGLKISRIINCFVEGDYTLLVRHGKSMLILEDLREIDEIEFDAKYYLCKNVSLLRGRHAQQVSRSVYAADNYACLYRIDWQDIKDGKYDKTLVKENVENFYLDRRLGLATLNLNHTLSLPDLTEVDLKAKVGSIFRWTIVTCIAKCWIVCGDLFHSEAIMATIDRQGEIKSALKLKLTSNGYKNRDGRKFEGIFTLQKAFVRGRRGIIFAIERDGYCHLISVNYGRLSMLQSIDSIVNLDVNKNRMSDRIVMTVTATGTEGEFIVGGVRWTRRISLKLK